MFHKGTEGIIFKKEGKKWSDHPNYTSSSSYHNTFLTTATKEQKLNKQTNKQTLRQNKRLTGKSLVCVSTPRCHQAGNKPKGQTVGEKTPWNVHQPDKHRWIIEKCLNVGMCAEDFCALRSRTFRTPTPCVIHLPSPQPFESTPWSDTTHVHPDTLGGSPTGDPPSSPGFSNVLQNDFKLPPVPQFQNSCRETFPTDTEPYCPTQKAF